MGARPFELCSVENKADPEVLRELKRLEYLAKEGELTGLAYVGILRGNGYHGDAVGRARRFPALAIGLLRALEAKLLPML